MRSKLPAAAAPRSLTLTLSLWLLGAIAVFQLFALTFKVVPPVGGKALAALDGQERSAEDSQPVTPYRPQPAPATAPQATPPPGPSPDLQQAQAFLLESQKFQRIGQWDQALPYLEQAIKLRPQEPSIMYQYAFVLGRLQREAEALDVLDSLVALPNLTPDERTEVKKLASLLEQTQANVQKINPNPSTSDPLDYPSIGINDGSASQSLSPLLENSGLQPGATLGVVNVQDIAQINDKKGLRIAIKCRPDVKVDNRNVEVRIRFFEKNPAGDVVLTNSQASLEWFSQPIDWKDDLPELVDAIYPLPGTKGASEDSAQNTYYGYTVGVYFNGELQDSRAEPEQLQRDFPLELFLKNKE